MQEQSLSFIQKADGRWDCHRLLFFAARENRSRTRDHHEAVSQLEFGRYSALRPKDNLELQFLAQRLTLAYDYSVGAEIFLKAMAKKLGLKTSRIKTECPVVKSEVDKAIRR